MPFPTLLPRGKCGSDWAFVVPLSLLGPAFVPQPTAASMHATTAIGVSHRLRTITRVGLAGDRSRALRLAPHAGGLRAGAPPGRPPGQRAARPARMGRIDSACVANGSYA